MIQLSPTIKFAANVGAVNKGQTVTAKFAIANVPEEPEMPEEPGIPEEPDEPSSPVAPSKLESSNKPEVPSILTNTVEFKDVDEVQWAYEHMIAIGTKLSEETLQKITKQDKGDLSRELLAQVMYEILEEQQKEFVMGEIIFEDITNSPYKKAIQYCAI